MCGERAFSTLFIVIGIYLLALLTLVLVKPFRRVFQERRLVKVTALVLPPALVFWAVYAAGAYVDAYFDVYAADCCCHNAQQQLIHCDPELANPDFARELCLRNLIPPFAQQACYTDEQSVCNRLSQFFSKAQIESIWMNAAAIAAVAALLSELPLLLVARRGGTPRPHASVESPP